MSKIKSNIEILDNAIRLLQIKREQDYLDLRMQFHETSESLKPVNLLKDTMKEFTHSTDVKSSLFETLIGVAGGYISKKLIMGKSHSLVKRILGYGLQFAMTTLISKKVNVEPEKLS